jgi:hypothetical protein
MTKDEILRLHTLSEDEQEKILIDNKILKSLHFKLVGCKVYESLADCAFRLRDEVSNNKFWHCAIEVISMLIDPERQRHPMSVMFYAKPIHWIQAALLEKREKGE